MTDIALAHRGDRRARSACRDDPCEGANVALSPSHKREIHNYRRTGCFIREYSVRVKQAGNSSNMQTYVNTCAKFLVYRVQEKPKEKCQLVR